MGRLNNLAFSLAVTLGLVFSSALVQADVIIGFNAGIRTIDPLTGAVYPPDNTGVTQQGLAFVDSPGPIPGTYFVVTPNRLLVPLIPGSAVAVRWIDVCGLTTCVSRGAYDSSTGTIFGLEAFGQVVLLTDTGQSGPVPDSHLIHVSSPIGVIPSASVIVYIQGLGLYGTDGHNAYVLNATTGNTTTLPSLVYGGPAITGLAYDPVSGRLIGVSGNLNAPPGTTSDIWNINPLTGQITLLNADAPYMYGIASVITPEPASVFLLAGGALSLLLLRLSSRAVRRPTR